MYQPPEVGIVEPFRTKRFVLILPPKKTNNKGPGTTAPTIQFFNSVINDWRQKCISMDQQLVGNWMILDRRGHMAACLLVDNRNVDAVQ